jgi:PKD repeat protein
VSYEWNFGDGSATVTGDSVSHTYSTTGTYTTIVTASNTAGSETATTDVTIEVQLQGPSGVTIDGPTTGIIGVSQTFTATADPSDTPSLVYTWTPEPEDGQGTAIVTYNWTTQGSKTIEVVAKNNGGQATDTHDITIGTPSLTLDRNPAEVRPDGTVTFTATVDPLIQDYDHVLFDFGDGSDEHQETTPTSDSMFVVEHTYTVQGTYTAIATLISDVHGGSIVSDTQEVTVLPPAPTIESLDASRTELPADERSTTILTATVMQEESLASGLTVTFTTSLGEFTENEDMTVTATTNDQGQAIAMLRSADVGEATVVATTGESEQRITITFTEQPATQDNVVEVEINPDEDTTATIDHEYLGGVRLSVTVKDGTTVTDSNGLVVTARYLRITAIEVASVTSKPGNALDRFFLVELIDQDGNIIEAANIQPPIEFSLEFGDATDLNEITAEEIGVLYQKSNGSWDNEGIETIDRNQTNRRVRLSTNHLTMFGMVQVEAVTPEADTNVYLPMIMR